VKKDEDIDTRMRIFVDLWEKLGQTMGIYLYYKTYDIPGTRQTSKMFKRLDVLRKALEEEWVKCVNTRRANGRMDWE